jgi:anaerobic magnesium-protoporphyrin IX monomethyl ester cyclase
MPKKVVFFFPSFPSREVTAPLGLLAVATPLLQAGDSIQLIDSTITPNFKKRVLEEVRDALCLGVPLVTGFMVRGTVNVARAVKAWDPHFPIVLGGCHPSLRLVLASLEARFAAAVVRAWGSAVVPGVQGAV